MPTAFAERVLAERAADDEPGMTEPVLERPGDHRPLRRAGRRRTRRRSTVGAGHDHVADRPERRRQDHAVQRAHRPAASRRAGTVRLGEPRRHRRCATARAGPPRAWPARSSASRSSPGMTVFENLQVAAEAASPGPHLHGPVPAAPPRRAGHRRAASTTVLDLVGPAAASRDRVAGLAQHRRRCASSSSAGRCAPTRRCCCSTSRAAASTRPRPRRSRPCSATWPRTGVGVLLVEHDVELVMALSRADLRARLRRR